MNTILMDENVIRLIWFLGVGAVTVVVVTLFMAWLFFARD